LVPPVIFAVYLVFASNFDEGVSVTEVGLVEGFRIRVALIGLVLLPENSWTVSEVSVAACTASEKKAVTSLMPRSTPCVPSMGLTSSTSGGVLSILTVKVFAGDSWGLQQPEGFVDQPGHQVELLDVQIP
jgi:hypothetical protein